MSTTILRHVHLPQITPFAKAQRYQQALVQQFLSHKALVSASSRSPSESSLPPPPIPTILTFTPTPVYTLGRREHNSLSSEQRASLLAPLISDAGVSGNPGHGPAFAEIEQTQRGGQTTFHGPGQLVIYPIIDLKPRSPFPLYERGLTVRCYVSLLEQATIDTLAQWGIESSRTEDPGVWEKRKAGEEGFERKIAALGVHLRRNITSYGVGLNVTTNMAWFDRIVACGLVGKGVTSMAQAGRDQGIWKEIDELGNAQSVRTNTLHSAWNQGDENADEHGQVQTIETSLDPSTVSRAWVRAFARGLYGEGGENRAWEAPTADLDVQTNDGRRKVDVVG